MPFLSLLLLLGSTSGLRVLDNGLGLPVYGAEDNVVDFASLANDQKADLPSQVGSCSFISYGLNPPFLPFPSSIFVRFVIKKWGKKSMLDPGEKSKNMRKKIIFRTRLF